MASITSYTKEKIDELIGAVNLALKNKANASHTHTMGQVEGLTSALDGKAAKLHTHSVAQIEGLAAALNEGGAPKQHTHVSADITDAVSVVQSANKNRVLKTSANGDLRVDSGSITDQLSVVNKKYVDDNAGGTAPWVGTESQYNAIGTKDPQRLYVIVR